MTNPLFRNAYTNPWDDKRDSGYLSVIAEALDRWFKARNGQKEDLEIVCRWGVDKSTGRSMSLFITVGVKAK